MIKKYFINKIIITSLCLFLMFVFYIIPTKDELKYETIIESSPSHKVYLLDSDNYVSEVISYYDSFNIYDEVSKRINVLKKGENGFYPLIPSNTKINSIKIDKNSVYIDFSKDLLNVSFLYEEKMIESIVYTLSEINGIDNIYISVDGKRLECLPHSKKIITYPLNRNYGINKEYDIESIYQINKTTVYFSKKNNYQNYYVPVTKVSNNDDEKIEIIIRELKSSINSQNNLNSYINNNVVLTSYKIDDNKMELVFNDILFSDLNVLEQIKNEISKSVFDNYNIDELIIKSNGKEYTITSNT